MSTQNSTQRGLRVGILTFHRTCNAGATLQAYGLKRAIESLGHCANFINYVPPAIQDNWWRIGFRSGTFPEVLLLRPKFHEFQDTHLPKSSPVRGIDDLRRLATDYDTLVVGSDQVWNFRILKQFDPVFFLDLPRADAPWRVSYAACFGQPAQPPDYLNCAKKLLNDFDCLSVRNAVSAEIVTQLTGTRPKIVMDPTFLDDFSSIELPAPEIRGNYVLINCLQRADASRLLSLAKEAAAARGVETVVALSTNFGLITPGVKVKRFEGPIEWLSFLKHADFVVTDSFHSTVFSIKYSKPFAVSIRADGMTHRIRHLLNRYDLVNRLLAGDMSAPQQLFGEIDFTSIHRTIETEVEDSMSFLQRALVPDSESFKASGQSSQVLSTQPLHS